jgi:hypothetical protein
MRRKLSALAVLLLTAGAPAAGHTQGINSSLGGDLGGVGVGPNGAGFDGTLGDPLWLASHPTLGAAPFSYYPIGRHAPAGPAAAPAAPAAAPPPPAGTAPFEYYYVPPPARSP